MKNLVGFNRAAAAALILATAFASALVFSPTGAASPALVGTNINVNSTSDAVADDGLCTLREAITSANLNAASGAASGECAAGTGDDTITFSVTGTLNLTGALPAVASNVTITGPGSGQLDVRRNTGGDYRIFTVNSGATVNISGLTAANGKTPDGASDALINGGGISNAGTLTLTDVAVKNNKTGGGAVGSGGSGGNGGGIYNAGTLTMTNCAVELNSTGKGGGGGGMGGSGGYGGGIYIEIGGVGIFTNLSVGGNTTGDGGLVGMGGGGGGLGAGIFNWHGTVTLTNSTVNDNNTGIDFAGTQGSGGGLGNYGDLTILGSIIYGNTGVNGSAIGNGNGVLSLTNSTVSGNRSSVAIEVRDNPAATTLTNCTITANPSGGVAVFSSLPPVVRNTIIARSGPDVSGSFNSQGHNLVGKGDGSTGFAASGDQVGTGAAPIDPRLTPLGSYGGPTATHALLAGSPALDAGDNTLAKDASNNALTTDQRGAGFARFADSADTDTTQTVDIGAFEANPTVEDITDKTTGAGTLLSFNFNVGDSALGLSSVTAVSSDASLVPNDAGHISVSGSGSQRTLNITPTTGNSGATTITVTVTAANGHTATDTFLLNVTLPNQPPTGLSLSNSSVADNSPAGTTVGTLSTSDPNAGDTFVYSLVNGAGGLDNGSFAVSGSTLKTNGVFDFETKSLYSVRVRSTDSGGLTFDKVLFVNVTDGPDTPGAVSFSSTAYNVGEADGSATITLTRTGGADNRVVVRVGLSDVTTSPNDYVYAPGSLDTSFNPGSGVNDFVRALALQPDGKVVIVGDFTNYNGTARGGVARLNADGSLDTSLNPGSGASASFIRSIAAVALQPDGKILIGGNFNNYNGTPINGIARLNSDGSLDTSFNPGSGVNDFVRALALQPDGKVVIGGDFTNYNGTSRGGVARVNADGSLDTSFNPGSGVDNSIRALVVRPDGKILIGGDFTIYNGTSRGRIARLNSDGSLDTSFNPGSGVGIGIGGGVRALALQLDGKLLIGGGIASYNGTSVNGLLRVNSDGSRDASFNPGFVNQVGVAAIALQPNGKVIAGMYTSDGAQLTTLTRLNTGGSLDTSFNVGTGPSVGVFAAALQPGGKVVIGGSFNTYNDTPRTRIARVNGDLFVTWEAGDSSDKTVTLPIVNDTTPEQNETLSLNVFGAFAGSPSSATLTINDNDASVSQVSGSGTYAGTATLTATLTGGGNPLAGKSVAFTLNGNSVGSATTNASGVATLTGVSLSGINVGTYANAIGAAFAGDANFTGSSGTGTLTVSKADTATAVSSSPNPSASGQSVTFTATVTSSAGTPTGTIQFKVDGTNLGSAVALDASGTASGSTTTLSLGRHIITAVYSGDAVFNTSTGTLAGGQSVVPTVSINDTFKSETDEPNETSFAVSLSAAVNFPVTVKYATADGTATSPSDYQAATGTVIFQPGESSKILSVTVNGDATYEDTETFFVDLSTPTNAVIDRGRGTALIINDDLTGGVIEFDQSSYTVAEGSSLTVTVKRGLQTNLAVDVDYSTDDGSTPSVVVPCSATTGIALDRCDYTKALGTIHFAPGETEKTFKVLINDDSFTEGPETAHLRLSNPRGNAALGPKSDVPFTITDDSPESTGNPIDDDIKFVTQHYRDFLNREPDAPGLAFWVSQIASCGSDAQCREAQRINVSGAFFLSIEFQETGYLVERTYKTAYGDATSPGVAGTVPVIRLNEFLPDTQRIGQGLVVGQGNWQAQLEANKVAYFADFVSRPRFVTGAPTTLSPAQLVDALFANAGVTPTAAERQAAIDEFGAASNTADQAARARALRRVAENPTLNQREFNRAFVLMQYYGYLRRNPDDAPEQPTLNFAGWKFWLDKLNQFNGNFKQAEMVKAFIASDEYRHRFGQ
jgi:uncharacterized delta-60 repeat protein/CSLREA domain-containing protein